MRLTMYFSLVKGNISILASLSAVAGFILSAGESSLSPALPGVFLGTLLIAMGASALNQYQERDVDAKMERTRNRPIPSGEISPGNALKVALALSALGWLVLLYAGGPVASGLGVFALLWYTLVYTNLKKVTAFAVIPGAIVGAIPPAIGWVSAGGMVTDPELVILSFFFFIWQVPHFWLLTIRYGEDFKRAGLPAPSSRFSKKQLSRITFIWLMATAVTSLSLPLFNITGSPAIGILLTAGATLFILCSMFILKKDAKEVPVPALFRATNFFALLVILLISIDGLI
ncbi:MAG: protoheme IX farnesyltransferase [Deltaproteobacteria bacterium]|nr:protoheme IX farnesyltransferase [Deltaproteobacteria bacterium]